MMCCGGCKEKSLQSYTSIYNVMSIFAFRQIKLQRLSKTHSGNHLDTRLKMLCPQVLPTPPPGVSFSQWGIFIVVYLWLLTTMMIDMSEHLIMHRKNM